MSRVCTTRVMFCAKCHACLFMPVSCSVRNAVRVLCHCPFHVRREMSREFMPVSCSVQNVTRVYAIFMFCAKHHPCLCPSYSVPNVTRVYARDMFCGIRCHTCLCHWLCHVMCKIPRLIMQLTVSCFVQNSTRDYAIGRVMFCVKCHEYLCHWPCHVLCKMSRVFMPLAVSCSVQNITRGYARVMF